MNEQYDDVELEELADILEEEFDPDLFYRALTNALVQLDSYMSQAA